MSNEIITDDELRAMFGGELTLTPDELAEAEATAQLGQDPYRWGLNRKAEEFAAKLAEFMVQAAGNELADWLVDRILQDVIVAYISPRLEAGTEKYLHQAAMMRATWNLALELAGDHAVYEELPTIARWFEVFSL